MVCFFVYLFIKIFRYTPVTVDHTDSRFILHQGIQRRIGITICHETNSELIWKNVREVVIGRKKSNNSFIFSYFISS